VLSVGRRSFAVPGLDPRRAFDGLPVGHRVVGGMAVCIDAGPDIHRTWIGTRPPGHRGAAYAVDG
jgi:hypothetical protein